MHRATRPPVPRTRRANQAKYTLFFHRNSIPSLYPFFSTFRCLFVSIESRGADVIDSGTTQALTTQFQPRKPLSLAALPPRQKAIDSFSCSASSSVEKERENRLGLGGSGSGLGLGVFPSDTTLDTTRHSVVVAHSALLNARFVELCPARASHCKEGSRRTQIRVTSPSRAML